MRKLLAIITASMLASASFIGAGAAQESGEEELRRSPGASEYAPGQQQEEPGGAAELAPGQTEDGSARDAAPGQQMQAAEPDDDEITTGAVGQPNFGTVISTLRTSDMDISGVEADAQINRVEIDELAETGERQALDNALSDRQDDIDRLREDLRTAGLSGLDEAEIDRVVATEVEADGSLTIYLE